jgi:hypothetical protein
VTDVISPDIAVTPACGVSFPYSLAAGGTLECTYASDLPDATDRVNTATVAMPNKSYPATADIKFGAPTTEIDECINVTDDKYGALGTICANELPKTFKYSLTIGPYQVCGQYEFKNIASFVTNDTGAEGSASWTVLIDVPCLGCTYTQGYWKTHSSYGPAAHPDDGWYLVDFDGDGNFEGPDEMIFDSGMKAIDVFNMAPKGGNAWFILAHQWMAAKLNQASGAASVGGDWLADAEELLDKWDGDGVSEPLIPKDDPDRAIAIEIAGHLADYNEGTIGPGHCGDETF